VEDVPAGIRAGKAAGARVIACTTTVPESELKAAGADWIMEGCKSICLISAGVASHELTLVLNR
jgi:beta-phosphoglucomutase-like phosphatase (HAD superfamily)